MAYRRRPKAQRGVRSRSGRRISQAKTNIFTGAAGAAAAAVAASTIDRAKRKIADRVIDKGSRAVKRLFTERTVQAKKDDDGGFEQQSNLTKSFGVPDREDLSTAWKELKSAIVPVYYRWQNMLSFESAQGGVTLDRTQSTSPAYPASGSQQNMPMLLFDLTAIDINGVTLNSGVPVGWRLIQTSTGPGNPAGYDFVQTVSGQGPTGGVLTAWTPENKASGLTGAADVQGPGRRDIFSWLDARLICVGASSLATTFTIQFIQFNEDWLVPEWTPANTEKNIESWTQERSATFESMVFPYVSSPIDIQNPLKKRNYKVIHKVEFVLQAKNSFEMGGSGHFKIVKLKKYFNKEQLYDWQQIALTNVLASATANSTQYEALTASFNPSVVPTVAPRDRVFMSITATNMTGNSVAATVCPSVDIMLRKCHLQTRM